MRRDVLVKSIEAVALDIEATNLSSILMHGSHASRGDSKNTADWLLLDSIARLYSKYTSYNEDTKQLINLLKIGNVYDASFWQKMISEPDPELMYDLGKRTSFLTEYLVNIANVFGPNRLDFDYEIEHGEETQKDVRIIIPEEESGLKPERLTLLIESISKLYESLCVMNGYGDVDLTITALDSGSDKIVVFGGLGDAIKRLNELIFDIWDRIVLDRRGRVHAEMNIIAKSLPILDDVQSRMESKALSNEDGERLKRQIVDGVTGFIECGAITQQIEEYKAPNPKNVIYDRRVLLTGPDQNSKNMDEEPQEDSSDSKETQNSLEDENATLRAKIAELEKGKSSRRKPKQKKK